MSIKAQEDQHGGQRQDGQDRLVVAVKRQTRHAVYGKIQRKTSGFVAHNEGNRGEGRYAPVEMAGARACRA